jgi:heme-degrading monooxygenase HmoA
MAVKILIRRHVSAEQGDELAALLKQLRQMTMNQEGYIYGETLTRIDRPGESLVISTWQSLESWRRWLLSDERAGIQQRIDELLGEKTEYAVYQYL